MTIASNILLLCQNKLLRTALADQLAIYPDFSLSFPNDSKDFKAQTVSLADQHCDLIIIDQDYFPIKPKIVIRSLRHRTPVIILEQDPSSGGADNCYFITKPLHFKSLLFLVRQILKDYANSKDNVYMLGAVKFYPGKHILVDANEGVLKLTAREGEILTLLCRARGKIVNKEELLDQVLGYHVQADTHTLETHIYRLRQKLESSTPHHQTANIVISQNGGYKIDASHFLGK